MLWCDWANTLEAGLNLFALSISLFALDISIFEIATAAIYGLFALYLGLNRPRRFRASAIRAVYLLERFRYFRNLSSFPRVIPVDDPALREQGLKRS